MRQMIYGNYPSFDELLETLKELESDVNALVGVMANCLCLREESGIVLYYVRFRELRAVVAHG